MINRRDSIRALAGAAAGLVASPVTGTVSPAEFSQSLLKRYRAIGWETYEGVDLEDGAVFYGAFCLAKNPMREKFGVTPLFRNVVCMWNDDHAHMAEKVLLEAEDLML